MEVFAAIEWRRFEAIEALFAQAGLRRMPNRTGPMVAWTFGCTAATALARRRWCNAKHWQSKPVGRARAARVYGVMASHKLKRGTFATTSTYARGLAFCAGQPHSHAGRRRAAATHQPPHACAATGTAASGFNGMRESIGAHLCQLRHQDGGAQPQQRWRPVLGLHQLPRCKRTLPKATGG